MRIGGLGHGWAVRSAGRSVRPRGRGGGRTRRPDRDRLHGGAVVRPPQGHRHPWRARRRSIRTGSRRAPLPGRQVDGVAGGADLRQGQGQVPQSRSAPGRRVEGDRGVRSIPQDPVHHTRERVARPHLDERAHAIGRQRLHEVDPGDGSGELSGQQRANGVGLVGIGTRRGVGVDGRHGPGQRDVGQGLCELTLRPGDEAAVEGRPHGQPPRAQPAPDAGLLERADRVAGAGGDPLLRRVPVRQDESTPHLGDHLLDRRERREHGEHRAPVRAVGRHRPAAGPGGEPQTLRAQHPRRVQRHQLAVAVTGEAIAPHPEAREHVEHPARDRAEGRLRHLRRAQPRVLLRPGALPEHRRRMHEGRRRLRLQRVEGLREQARQLPAHPHVLRPLSREQQRQRAGGTKPDGGPVRRRRREPRHGQGGGPLESGPGVFAGLDHEHRPRCVGRPEPGARRGRRASPIFLNREVPQGDREPRPIGRARGQDLHPAVPGDRRRGVLLEHDVEVAAAKAEGADPGAAAHAPAQPGPRGGVEIERTSAILQARQGRAHLERGRQHPMLQGQGRLDQPRRARRRLRVSDHRLDGPDGHRARRHPRVPVDQVQPLDLGAVSGLGSGAVSLQQADVGGAHARLGIGGPEGPRLTRAAGRVDGLRAPVAGAADAREHRVDPIAVPLRVRQALQHDDADALAQDRAVAVAVEGPGVAGLRERRRRREALVHEDVVEGVDAARDDDVGAAGPELHHAHLDGAQGARAGRVDHAVGAAQVQPIGDASGDHVPQEPGEARLLPAHIRAGDAGDDILGRLRVDTRLLQRLAPAGVAQPGPEVHDQLLRARHAEDHACPGLVPLHARPVARVRQRPARDEQPEQLGRVRGFEDRGRDPELRGVEVHRIQEAAPGRVQHVRRGRIRVEVVLGAPVAVPLGQLPDGVHAGAQVVPEARQIRGLGKQAGHADDRDRAGPLHDLGHARRLLRGPGPIEEVVQRRVVQRLEPLGGRGHQDALGAQRGRPGRHRGPDEQVARDRHHAALGDLGEATSLGPAVEGAHRRAAPHLEVDPALGHARVRPPARQPQVAAEQQGQPVLRLLFGAVELARVPLPPERRGVSPRLIEAAAEDLGLQLGPLLGGQLLDGSTALVQTVEPARPHGEERAPAQHLEIDSHLEHVGGRRHRHVGRARLVEQLADRIGRARLQARLVDGPGDYVGGAQPEGGRHRTRRAQPAGRADPRRSAVPEAVLQLIPQRLQARQQHHEGTVVRVASGVRLRGDVLGDRHALRQPGLLNRDRAFRDQLRDHPRRGRAQEPARHLGSRDLRQDPVRRDHRPAHRVDPRQPVPDQGQGQVQVGRRADAAHAALEIQRDDRLFDLRLAGRVDQVDSPRRIPHVALDPLDRGRDLVDGEPRRAEEAEHPAPSHRHHQLDAGDPVGHGPRDVGVAHAVGGPEDGVPELLRMQRGRESQQRKRRTGRLRPQQRGPAGRDREPPAGLHQGHRPLDLTQRARERVRGPIRAHGPLAPPPQGAARGSRRRAHSVSDKDDRAAAGAHR